MINIRNAKLEDAQRLVEIYSYYVLNTAVSFEYEVPTVAEFQERMKKVMEKYPYLVAEEDGQIVGYAYSSPYSCREAYAWSVANSIYLDKDHRRKGIGSLLYQELERHLKENGIINLLAGVAFTEEEDEYLTHGSYNFHTRMGYEKVAHMKDIGKKFDRWYDLLWLQKKI